MRLSVAAILLLLAALVVGCSKPQPAVDLVIGICDPLAKETASECVKSAATREYETLASTIQKNVNAKLTLRYYLYDTQIVDAMNRGEVNAVITKTWSVLRSSRPFERIADMPGPSGSNDLCGVFMTLTTSPARTAKDLDGKNIMMGPDGAYEKSFAARRALAAAGANPASIDVLDGCVPVLAAVFDKKADAGVISSYVAEFNGIALVSDPSDFREIARTAPVPFMTVAVSTDLPHTLALKLREVLLSIAGANVPPGLNTTGFTVPAPWSPEELTK